MSSEDVVDTVWQTINGFLAADPDTQITMERILRECVNNVLKRAMIQYSEDNLTLIIICFKNLIGA